MRRVDVDRMRRYRQRTAPDPRPGWALDRMAPALRIPFDLRDMRLPIVAVEESHAVSVAMFDRKVAEDHGEFEERMAAEAEFGLTLGMTREERRAFHREAWERAEREREAEQIDDTDICEDCDERHGGTCVTP